jgi:NhaA family Na+:H+ antiporter
MQRNLDEFCPTGCEDGMLLTTKQLVATDNMEYYIEKVRSPLQKLEHSLHGFVTFFVMPVFALANAGVVFAGGHDLSGVDALTINIAISLIIGKFFGVFGFTYIFVKLGLLKLPGNLKWVHFMGLGLLGGVGFTMSIFISTLAFSDVIILNHAKLGILIGSFLAGICGYFLLRTTLRKVKEDVEE